MLKNYGAAWALAGLIFVAVVGNLVSQPPPKSPYYGQKSEQKERASDQTQNTPPNFIAFKLFTSSGRDEIAKYCAANPEKETQDWPHKYVCDARITDAYIAFFGALLVGVTGGLVWVGYRQIITARAQLRAYVFVHTAKVAILDDEVTVPAAVVVIKNSGQTPARKLINVSGFAVSPYPIQVMPNLLITDREFAAVWTNMDLGPESTTATITKISPDPIFAKRAAKAEFVKGLSEGKLVAFVYGEVRYRDVFRRRQCTKYRLMMGGPIGFAEGQLVGCSEGNEAT